MKTRTAPERDRGRGLTDVLNNPNRACNPEHGIDGDDFYSDRDSLINHAKRVCALCPLKTDCLMVAVENGEKFGVWGGVLMSSFDEKHQAVRSLKMLDEIIHRLWTRGLHDTEIGDRLGLDKSSVRRRRTLLGLPANYQGGRIPTNRVAA
jgi:WhiB family redox-sensing transcriptional regulator